MRSLHVATLLFLVSQHALAQAAACEAWASKLKSEIHTSNGCESKYQACKDMGPTNPMRELNYCQNLLAKCESMNGPFESEAIRAEVERFRQQCS